MKGLEISEISLSEYRQNNAFFRLDSEFSDKRALQIIRSLRQANVEQFGISNPEIIHPHEITRRYVEDGGIWFFRAQNLRPMTIEENDTVFVSHGDAAALGRNELKNGDVVITRTGANAGDCALFTATVSAVASSHTFIIRSNRWNHGFLVAFLNSDHGRAQILRARYGAVQPEVAPYYLKGIWIPRFSAELQKRIAHHFELAQKQREIAKQSIAQAEQILLRALGLKSWQPPEPLTYTRRASEVLEHGRFDAEHYQEQYYALAAKLREHPGGVATLGELCPNPMNGVEIREYAEEGVPYLRVGDIKNYTVNPAGVKFVAHEAAAKEIDKVRLQTGDVLVSRSGSLAVTGVVEPEWKHSVISSHLILVRLQDPAFKPHYVAAFLAAMPGKMQIIQHSNGGVQPEINQPSLKRVLIPRLADSIQTEIITQIRQAHTARQQAQTLLATAKRAVEVAIEEGEAAAMQILHSA